MGGVPGACHLALHPPPLLERVGVACGQLLAVVFQQPERALPLGDAVIAHALGLELPLDPAQHAEPGDAVDLAGPRPVSEAVQRVQRGVAGGEALGG